MKPSKMVTLSQILGEKNYVERQNRSTNNGGMDDKAKRPVSECEDESVTSI